MSKEFRELNWRSEKMYLSTKPSLNKSGTTNRVQIITFNQMTSKRFTMMELQL